MRSRTRGKRGEVRVLYSVPELAELAGVTRFAMGRLLKHYKVRTVEFGASGRMVPLVAIRDGIPDVWNSIVLRLGLGDATTIECAVCGAEVQV